MASVLREFTSGRKSGLLFHTSTGAQLLQSNTLQDSLHPILEALNHGKGGFNIFRRFGLTHLEKSDCPDALKHFWSGHAPIHVSERYTKFLGERQYRLDWTERIGMGFSVANPANFRWYRESRKLLKRWWTRGDSNPRPPRCERGRKFHKTRCCNHLRLLDISLNGQLGQPLASAVRSTNSEHIAELREGNSSPSFGRRFDSHRPLHKSC